MKRAVLEANVTRPDEVLEKVLCKLPGPGASPRPDHFFCPKPTQSSHCTVCPDNFVASQRDGKDNSFTVLPSHDTCPVRVKRAWRVVRHASRHTHVGSRFAAELFATILRPNFRCTVSGTVQKRKTDARDLGACKVASNDFRAIDVLRAVTSKGGRAPRDGTCASG